MSKFGKIFLIFITVFLFLQAGAVFAGLELEQTYPEIGIEIQTITKDTTIPRLIKYYSTWAIIIAILVSVISLIAGGVIYLTSSGKPAAVALARKRIIKSLIGLAILTCSYLILNIINPQFEILQIKKVPVTSGIIMLNKDGYKSLTGTPAIPPNPPISAKPLKDIIENGNALPMGYWVLDAVNSDLGALETVSPDDRNTKDEPTRVNFKNFQFYAVGFWGKDAKNVKLITHSAKNFEDDKKEYTFEGELDEQGHLIQGKSSTQYGSDPEVNVIVFDQDGFFQSQVAFTDKHAAIPVVYKLKDNPPPVYHPPLSWRREGIGPGVYLYSNTAQRYLSSGSAIADFSSSLFGGLVDIKDIEIRNVDPKTDVQHDILAILRARPNYRGGIRIFFEKNLVDIAEIFLSPPFLAAPHPTFGFSVAVDMDVLLGSSTYYSQATKSFTFTQPIYRSGNVPAYDKDNPADSMIEVQKLDHYGKVSEVLSARTFALSNDKSVCKEVKICNQIDGQGFCISYSLGGKNRGHYQTFTFPMPWYLPIGIPRLLVGTVKMRDGKMEKLSQLGPGGGVNPNAQFAKNIRSIEIDGKCLVVLFESNIKFDECIKCANGQSNACKDCWATLAEPGGQSEVFVNYGEFNGGDPDLSDNPIGVCSGGAEGTTVKDVAPCASGIVVFPLK